MKYTIFGATEPQDFQIMEDEQPFNGAGYSVEAVFSSDMANDAVTAAWLEQSEGKVRLTGVENIPPGQYKFRLKVIADAGGAWSYVPSEGLHDWWRVRRP